MGAIHYQTLAIDRAYISDGTEMTSEEKKGSCFLSHFVGALEYMNEIWNVAMHTVSEQIWVVL